MGEGIPSINLFGQRETGDEFVGLYTPGADRPAEDQAANLIPPVPSNSTGDQNWQAAFTRHALEQRFQLSPAPFNAAGDLSPQTGVTVPVKPSDTQVDVLRRAYQSFAAAAGLSEPAQQTFVETMMSSGDDRIHHPDTGDAFTDKEFQAFKRRGSIVMYPTAGQIAELRRLMTEESGEALSVETKAYAQTGEITFKDATKARTEFLRRPPPSAAKRARRGFLFRRQRRRRGPPGRGARRQAEGGKNRRQRPGRNRLPPEHHAG